MGVSAATKLENGPAAAVKRILLVDDHELVRTAIAGALESLEGFEVVGQASSASEALALAVSLRPDLVLMDVDMPGVICFDAVARLRERMPELRVIFLSAYFYDHYIEGALRVGASGYVVKGGPLEVLFDALRTVAEGGAYYSQEVRARLVLTDEHPRLAPGPETRGSTLTTREVEVLSYLARGLSKKEIARTMGISVKTIEHHSASVMKKLDIHDRVELARYAIREGLAEA